jgi:solute carrier family 35, member F5
MLVTFLSDFLYVKAMLKTTPLVVTVGLSMTIPLAVLGDLGIGRGIRPQALVGALLVLVAFISVGIPRKTSVS